MSHLVSEVASDFGDQIAGDGGRIKDVRDEGGGAAEGFSYDGSVLDQDVMAVISDDENSAIGNPTRRVRRLLRRRRVLRHDG